MNNNGNEQQARDSQSLMSLGQCVRVLGKLKRFHGFPEVVLEHYEVLPDDYPNHEVISSNKP